MSIYIDIVYVDLLEIKYLPVYLYIYGLLSKAISSLPLFS